MLSNITGAYYRNLDGEGMSSTGSPYISGNTICIPVAWNGCRTAGYPFTWSGTLILYVK